MTFERCRGRARRPAAPSWPSATSTIDAGERVLITGDPGAGKTLFFRAIAGLWPWGSGRIGLPKGEAGDLHSAHALFPARNAARRARLSAGARTPSPTPSSRRR